MIFLCSYVIFLKNLNLHAYGLSACSSLVVNLISRPLRGQRSRSIIMKDLDKKVSYSYKVNISKAALRLQFSFVQEKSINKNCHCLQSKQALDLLIGFFFLFFLSI